MSMDRFYRYGRYFHAPYFPGLTRQFKEVTGCLIRKDHHCGKYLGASKSCFIACPSTEEVKILLALISEKLGKIGIEPVIAIWDRAYGQDIFCTKICGKIIESQFCLVILDDEIKKLSSTQSLNVPNPNVYYEYGLMTALNKYVIPLQKEGQELAFNIQTHDTIKYAPNNLSVELDKAFKDVVKITQEKIDKYDDEAGTSDRFLIRCLEINGYVRKQSNWFLSDSIDDTVFTAFGHDERAEYLLFSFINDKNTLRIALSDMQVIIKRVESKHKELSEKIATDTERINKINEEIEKIKRNPTEAITDNDIKTESITRFSSSMRYELMRTTQERDENLSKLRLLENSKFALILNTEISELKEKVSEEYRTMDNKIIKIPLYLGDINRLEIAGLEIVFKIPPLLSK